MKNILQLVSASKKAISTPLIKFIKRISRKILGPEILIYNNKIESQHQQIIAQQKIIFQKDEAITDLQESRNAYAEERNYFAELSAKLTSEKDQLKKVSVFLSKYSMHQLEDMIRKEEIRLQNEAAQLQDLSRFQFFRPLYTKIEQISSKREAINDISSMIRKHQSHYNSIKDILNGIN